MGYPEISDFLLATSEKEELPRVILVRAEIHLKSVGMQIKYKKNKQESDLSKIKQTRQNPTVMEAKLLRGKANRDHC